MQYCRNKGTGPRARASTQICLTSVEQIRPHEGSPGVRARCHINSPLRREALTLLLWLGRLLGGASRCRHNLRSLQPGKEPICDSHVFRRRHTPEGRNQCPGALERVGARSRSSVSAAEKSRFRIPRLSASAAAASVLRILSPVMCSYTSRSYFGRVCDTSRVPVAQSTGLQLGGDATPPCRTDGAPFDTFPMRMRVAAAVALSQCLFRVSGSHAPCFSTHFLVCWRGTSCGRSSGTGGWSMLASHPRL